MKAPEAEAAPIDPARTPEVAEYLAHLTRADSARGPLITAIHPADEMYLYELALGPRGPSAAAVSYFATGDAACRTVLDALTWRFGDPSGARLLDFASGHGRTTRFLVRRLPADRITISEIEPSAVRFQEETFGVRGVVSATDPADFRVDGAFDAIVACSFFSHLPEGRFHQWLARLYGLLAPGGMLLFSVHGMRLLAQAEADEDVGIVFRAASESRRLEAAEYGTTFVTPGWVRSAATAATTTTRGESHALLAFPHGLCGFQDLYALLRAPLPPALDLRLPRLPLGALERSAVADGRVLLEGWARGDTDERAPEVRLVFRNAVAETSPSDGAGGPRRTWRFEFPADAIGPDDLVRVEAVSARGLERILVMGTLRPYLPAAGAVS
ncbi:MAG TPA: class I SAM-dependent methyltransferase [Thermoanaerobaculia bacterium]|jgi:SAM-dependent methyltransferase|nr:class I SAM-dependent methyltransferase [Thermoanaerobaculia bacterium]